MIIGEAPGEWEEHLGRPFVGKSGEKLLEALKAAGASRDEFYITNVYKLRPLDSRGKNCPPTQRQIKSHSRYLCDELAALQPCAALLLGATALDTFLHRKGVEEHAGTPVLCHGRKYLPTFHPSHILQTGPRHKHSMRFFEDVKEFLRIVKDCSG